jgi:two-component system chemotaxis response regulator CheY
MRNSRLRFLIVDDFATSRRIIGKLLREIGFTEADEAADGRTALDMLLNARFDFVIADVDMPRLDGFGLVTAMRRHPDLQAIPALLVTREPSKEQVVRASRVGANGYVVQPLTRSGLEDRIRAILGLAGMTVPHRPLHPALAHPGGQPPAPPRR